MTSTVKWALGAGVAVAIASTFAWAQSDVRRIHVTSIQSISAAEDGAAWALSTDGTLLHCRFEDSKVKCFDRRGPARSEY